MVRLSGQTGIAENVGVALVPRSLSRARLRGVCYRPLVKPPIVRQLSIDDATWWFIDLEQCCKAQLAVQANGLKPAFVAPDRARYSREHVGSSFIGWLHFQPLYDHIARRQPEMFA